jgi:hypothetical protein
MYVNTRAICHARHWICGHNTWSLRHLKCFRPAVQPAAQRASCEAPAVQRPGELECWLVGNSGLTLAAFARKCPERTGVRPWRASLIK